MSFLPANNYLKAFIFSCLFILLAAMASHSAKAQDTTSLMMIGKLPVIKGMINGKPAYFIVDTGASMTVLNENESRFYGFLVRENKYYSQSQMIGIGGVSTLKEALFARIQLGSHDIRFVNKSISMYGLSGHFRDHNVRIAGIIGTDLLSILGCKIDYKSGTVEF